MTLSSEQDFCVLMRFVFFFPPPKEGLKLFLEKYGYPEAGKVYSDHKVTPRSDKRYRSSTDSSDATYHFGNSCTACLPEKELPQLQAAAS